MATPLDPTAWGNATLEVGTPGEGDVMATTLDKVGYVLQDSLGLEQEDGTVLQLIEEGGIIHDQMQQEGIKTIVGEMIGMQDDIMQRFWTTETDGTITWVKSTVTSNKFSFRISVPQNVGSKRMLIPYASMSLGVAYSSAQGWTQPFTITILTGATGNQFGWDEVPAPAEP